MRNALVASEIAFACVLLVGAGLLIRSLVRVLDVDVGFEPAGAATIRVDPDRRYATPEQQNAYIDEVLRRARDIPAVEAASITDALPLGRNRTWGARAKGVVYERGRTPTAFVRIVTDGYPAAMGIPLRAGRDLAPGDTAASEPVIIINETMARTLWPGEDPIGKVVLNACGAPERRVVGVVGDVRHLALEQASGNEMYIPMRQCGDRPSFGLVVRSTVAPAALAAALRETLEPSRRTSHAMTFGCCSRSSTSRCRRGGSRSCCSAASRGFALVLAALGIYTLISYPVTQRTQEIGLRMAVGATAFDIQRQIVRQTLALTAIGVTAGAAASWILARGWPACCSKWSRAIHGRLWALFSC